MIAINILEGSDTILPTDWYRPLDKSADFSCYSDAWLETNCYGGGPMDIIKWVPIWLVLGEVWWGKIYGEYGGFGDLQYKRQYEVVRGNLPESHKFNLKYNNWDIRHPLKWEEIEKEQKRAGSKIMSFGRHEGDTYRDIVDMNRGWAEWAVKNLRDEKNSELIKDLELLLEGELNKVYYKPKFREFLQV